MATLATPLNLTDTPKAQTGSIAKLNARVVRVVDGRHAGKEYPLADGARICIGHALANDVVLRGSGTRGTVLELHRDGDMAVLRVVQGSVELLGRTLSEGEEAQLPPYLPFRMGEFVLAHGGRQSARWEEAEHLATTACSAPAAPLPPPHLRDRLTRMGKQKLALASRFANAQLALAAFSVLLLAGAAGLFYDSFGAQQSRPGNFKDTLRDEGLAGLAVNASPAGGLIVSGVVRDEAQLTRLRQLASAAAVPVSLDVTSGSALADAATEVLQAQGIDAAAETDWANPNGIIVRAAYMPADRQAQIRELLQRDLAGLSSVAFRVDDARGGNPLQSFFASAGTGLATLVADPGYIVTADGARWFPGAILPTGHRLVSIENNTVRFEKDGRTEDIRL